MVKRAAVKKVVKMPQSKTVASTGGTRVLGPIKAGEGPNEGISPGSIAVDMAISCCYTLPSNGILNCVTDISGRSVVRKNISHVRCTEEKDRMSGTLGRPGRSQ